MTATPTIRSASLSSPAKPGAAAKTVAGGDGFALLFADAAGTEPAAVSPAGAAPTQAPVRNDVPGAATDPAAADAPVPSPPATMADILALAPTPEPTPVVIELLIGEPPQQGNRQADAADGNPLPAARQSNDAPPVEVAGNNADAAVALTPTTVSPAPPQPTGEAPEMRPPGKTAMFRAALLATASPSPLVETPAPVRNPIARIADASARNKAGRDREAASADPASTAGSVAANVATVSMTALPPTTIPTNAADNKADDHQPSPRRTSVPSSGTVVQQPDAISLASARAAEPAPLPADPTDTTRSDQPRPSRGLPALPGIVSTGTDASQANSAAVASVSDTTVARLVDAPITASSGAAIDPEMALPIVPAPSASSTNAPTPAIDQTNQSHRQPLPSAATIGQRPAATMAASTRSPMPAAAPAVSPLSQPPVRIVGGAALQALGTPVAIATPALAAPTSDALPPILAPTAMPTPIPAAAASLPMPASDPVYPQSAATGAIADPSQAAPFLATPTSAAAGTVGTTAPAAQAFAAAIEAADRQDRLAAARGQSESVAAGTVAPSAAPIAATGGSGAEQPSLDMRQPSWPTTMIDHIEKLRDAADATSTRIRIVPDALGSIDVSVRRHDDGPVQVSLVADRPQTQALIADARPELTRLADERGTRIEVSVGGGSSTGFGGHADNRQTDPRPQIAPRRAPASAFRPDDHSAPADGRVA